MNAQVSGTIDDRLSLAVSDDFWTLSCPSVARAGAAAVGDRKHTLVPAPASTSHPGLHEGPLRLTMSSARRILHEGQPPRLRTYVWSRTPCAGDQSRSGARLKPMRS